MKIIVCVKQVPDTSGKVAVKPDGTLDRASMATITNPDDLNAVEAALSIKDKEGCKVIVVTMGPPKAEEMLREILARGADEAVLVSAREFGGSDTYATSQILAVRLDNDVRCICNLRKTKFLCDLRSNLSGISVDSLTSAEYDVVFLYSNVIKCCRKDL